MNTLTLSDFEVGRRFKKYDYDIPFELVREITTELDLEGIDDILSVPPYIVYKNYTKKVFKCVMENKKKFMENTTFKLIVGKDGVFIFSPFINKIFIPMDRLYEDFSRQDAAFSNMLNPLSMEEDVC